MDLSIEKPDVEWYNATSGKGGIYDLANMAAYGAGKRERLRAVIGLGESDDPRAVRPLMDLLSDSDPEDPGLCYICPWHAEERAGS